MRQRSRRESRVREPGAWDHLTDAATDRQGRNRAEAVFKAGLTDTLSGRHAADITPAVRGLFDPRMRTGDRATRVDGIGLGRIGHSLVLRVTFEPAGGADASEPRIGGEIAGE